MGQAWSAFSSRGDEATLAFYQAIKSTPKVCREVAVVRGEAPYWSGVGVDSLVERCVEVIAGMIVAGQPFRLDTLPPELTQLVVDVVSNMGGGQVLTGRHMLESLGCARFFRLVLGGGAPGRGRLGAKGTCHSLGSLFPVSTLERLAVSDEPSAGMRVAGVRATPFDDKFLLQYAPACLKLRFVSISHCPAVTEVTVRAVLRGLPLLEEVVVAHCRGVGDVGGSFVSSACSSSSCGVGSPHLKRLVLESCLGLRGLGTLFGASSGGRLDSLRQLNLGRCHMLKNADAGQVARLSNLRWLDVSYTGITDAGVAVLAELRCLEHLDIAGLRVLDSSVARAVRQMPFLKHLDVSRTVLVGNSTLLALAAHSPSRLEKLKAAFTSVTNNGLIAALPALKALRHVDFDSCGVGNGLAALGDCQGLEVARLADTMAGNDVAEALSRVQRLERLDISFTPMVNEMGMRYISKIKGLRSLTMSTMERISEHCVELRLPRLSSLDLSGCRVTDEHCSVLSKMDTLRRLDLTGSEITSRGVEYLSKLRRLRCLSVSHASNVGDECVPFLIRMGGLVNLNVSGCPLSDGALLNLSTNLRLA